MITIIHGDDIVLSRNYLQEQKHKVLSPYVFDGLIDITTLIQITQGVGLFTSEKNIFVENFFSKNKLGNLEVKSVIDYINKNESLFNLFFWEAKELQKRSIALFTNPSLKNFKIPQAIFLFLDSIRPKNFKNSTILFHNALKNTLEELVFFMLQRQFRLLLAVSEENSKDSIDEITRLAPWQKSKLLKQAALFSSDKLLAIHKKLYKIEVAQKTGNLPYSLTVAIDFLLLSL
ncbi:MAG: hypothetical protein AAB600_05605 [Patescibacteria group bacterium]